MKIYQSNNRGIIINTFHRYSWNIFNDNFANNVNDIFKNYIYIDINTICNKKEFYLEDDNSVNFYIKKYEILNVPFILLLNMNLKDYNLVMNYKDIINKIFITEINLYGFNYQLIGLETQPSVNHFIIDFKNLNKDYKYSICYLFKYDYLEGYFKQIEVKIYH